MATPQVSDMPQSSPIGIPIAWKNSSTSTGVGAAPTFTDIDLVEAERLAEVREHRLVGGRDARGELLGDVLARLLEPHLLDRGLDALLAPARPPRREIAASFASRPALSFSQIRGTAKKKVGLTVGRNSMILRGSGQTVIERP